jgi:hypothetical protein
MEKRRFWLSIPLLIGLTVGCTTATSVISYQPSVENVKETSTQSIVVQSTTTLTPTSIIEATLTPSPILRTITSTPTEVPPSPVPTILFQDDFSDPTSGWERTTGIEGILDYQDGTYRMKIPVTNNLYWVQANLPLLQGDVAVQAAISRIGGPEDAPFGLICRLDSDYQYYYFYITGSGEYGIGKHLSAGSLGNVVLGSGTLDSTGAIYLGENVINRMLAVCQGNTLSLTVNDTLLLEVEDGDIITGDVGLLAGARGESGLDVVFDDFVVMLPE